MSLNIGLTAHLYNSKIASWRYSQILGLWHSTSWSLAYSKVLRQLDKTLANFTWEKRKTFYNIDTRVAAYSLLVELARNCAENTTLIIDELIRMHHTYNESLSKEFEYEPPIERRAACNFVGLKNAGATCYMNSVLQQLYNVPNICDQVRYTIRTVKSCWVLLIFSSKIQFNSIKIHLGFQFVCVCI